MILIHYHLIYRMNDVHLLQLFHFCKKHPKIILKLFFSQSTQSSFAELALLYCYVKPSIQHVQKQNCLSQYQSPPPISLQFCLRHPWGLHLGVLSISSYIQIPLFFKVFLHIFPPSCFPLLPSEGIFFLLSST